MDGWRSVLFWRADPFEQQAFPTLAAWISLCGGDVHSPTPMCEVSGYIVALKFRTFWLRCYIRIKGQFVFYWKGVNKMLKYIYIMYHWFYEWFIICSYVLLCYFEMEQKILRHTLSSDCCDVPWKCKAAATTNHFYLGWHSLAVWSVLSVYGQPLPLINPYSAVLTQSSE